MKLLGIDYGKKKVGLAISEGNLAEPYLVIRYRSEKELFEKVSGVSGVSRVVIGVSEGKMAEETREFGKRLGKELGIPVVYQDETLTTQKAQELSIDAGIKRKKRKKLEDAYSATLILQEYIDSNLN